MSVSLRQNQLLKGKPHVASKQVSTGSQSKTSSAPKDSAQSAPAQVNGCVYVWSGIATGCECVGERDFTIESTHF
jgi:hypothetical protein